MSRVNIPFLDVKRIQWLKENGILVVPFFAFFYLLRLSPMMYDGWAGPYYYKDKGGLINWFSYVMGPMRDYINGRVSSNFFSGILESFFSEIPLDLVCALILTGILYCLFAVFKIRNRIPATVVYMSLMFLMPYLMRTYVLQIACLQYVTPILFLLCALLFMEKYMQNNKVIYCIYFWFLSVIACTWMENTSVAYGVIVSLYCVEQIIKNGRIGLFEIGGVVSSLVSGLFMITSNGMESSRGIPENNGSFIQLGMDGVVKHLGNFFKSNIYCGALAHIVVALLFLAVCGQRYMNKKNLVNKSWGLLLLCFNCIMLTSFLFLGSISNEMQYTAQIDTSYCQYFVEHPKRMLLIVLIYFAWLVINIYALAPHNMNIYRLCIYGVVLLLVMIPTNQIEARIIAPFYIIMVCITTVVVGANVYEMKSKGRILIATIVLCGILAGDYYCQLCNRINEFNQITDERVEWLKEAQFLGQWDEDKMYIFPIANDRDLHSGGQTVIGAFHYPQFLYRKGLLPETKIEFCNE